jgi:hypothetical protein
MVMYLPPLDHLCRYSQEAVKVMAKSLVRNRHAVTKMYGLKSQLQAVSLRIAVSNVGNMGLKSACFCRPLCLLTSS